MISKVIRSASAPVCVSTVVTFAALLPLHAEQMRVFSKDVGPMSSACDAHVKGSAQWTRCVGVAKANLPDAELFYAGYWLAKTGHYAEALDYLYLARRKDEKVLTYIGFATRKLGDIEKAFGYYRQALETNPGYVVARAYLGEAYLTIGEPAKAKAELSEIAQRCGTTCAPYADLAQHIASYEASKG